MTLRIGAGLVEQRGTVLKPVKLRMNAIHFILHPRRPRCCAEPISDGL